MRNAQRLALICIFTSSALLATTLSAAAAAPSERRMRPAPTKKATVAPKATLSFYVKNMAGSATLTLDGEPLGDIALDDAPKLGYTFVTFEVTPGERALVARSGDKEVALTVDVNADEAVFVTVSGWSKRLVKVASRTPIGDPGDGPGKLVVKSAYEGTAHVDGERHKLAPEGDAAATLELELPAGPHYVAGILSKHPFKSQAHGVVVVAGETTTVTLHPGSALVESPQVEDWATVRVAATHVDGIHNLRVGDVVLAVVMRATDGAYEPVAFRLRPGKHTIEVFGPLSKVGDFPFEVAANDEVVVELAVGGKLAEKSRDQRVDAAPKVKRGRPLQRTRTLRPRTR